MFCQSCVCVACRCNCTWVRELSVYFFSPAIEAEPILTWFSFLIMSLGLWDDQTVPLLLHYNTTFRPFKEWTFDFIPEKDSHSIFYSLFNLFFIFLANKWLVVVVVYINDELEHGKDYPFVATQRHVTSLNA